MFFSRQCWELLVWLDIANFGGVKGKLPEELQNVSQENEKASKENDNDNDSEEDAEGENDEEVS